MLVEVLLLRRLYQSPELFILMGTFGVILVIQDLSRWLFGSEDLLGPRCPGLDGSIDILGTLLPQYDLALILIALLILLMVWWLLNRTRWGILVRAATEDREMLAALGVNQSPLFTSVFFLGSFLAGLGGALQLPKGGADLLMDLNVHRQRVCRCGGRWHGKYPGGLSGRSPDWRAVRFWYSHPPPKYSRNDVFNHGGCIDNTTLWSVRKGRIRGAYV